MCQTAGRTLLVTLIVVGVVAGCGGGTSGSSGNEASAQKSVSTVVVDGIGPALVFSPTDAGKRSSCTAYERATQVAITFVSRNPERACKEWIRRQSGNGSGESWSTTSTHTKRKVACIFFARPGGLVEVDSAENGWGNRLCAALGRLNGWVRFTAAESAKRDGRAIPPVLDVPSASMEPTLHCARPAMGCEAARSDLLVIDLVQPSGLKRDDIVVFNAPSRARECGSPGARWEKRLIGLPGERWKEQDGYIFIDGKKLREPYIKPDRRIPSESIPEQVIPKGQYVVLGDNRAQSCDSRLWGPVPSDNIIGRVSSVTRLG